MENKMKILKLEVKGLPLLKNDLSIDFIAWQRVDDDDKEQLYNIFSNIYTNPALSFIGINASGKTCFFAFSDTIYRTYLKIVLKLVCPDKVLEKGCSVHI